MPDEEVHAFVNEQERKIGTQLYGRRLYEVMVAWESPELVAGADPVLRDYAEGWRGAGETPELVAGAAPVLRDYAEVWRAADKIVYSTTLPAVTTARTRLERSFTP